MDSSNDRLAPLGVAAAVLGVPARELRAEVDAGRLPYTRVGEKAILLDLDLVRRVLAERAGRYPAPEGGRP
jgi:hypothetical protein